MPIDTVEADLQAVQHEALVINEVQLLLAEKRTSLAVLRTGLTVLALPMTLTSFLVATSKYYEWLQVWHVLILLIVMNLVLVGLGTYLISHALLKFHYYSRRIHELAEQSNFLKKLLKPN